MPLAIPPSPGLGEVPRISPAWWPLCPFAPAAPAVWKVHSFLHLPVPVIPQSPAQRRSTYCLWSALRCLSTTTLSVLHSLSGAAVVAHCAVLLCQPVRLGIAHILILSSRHFSLTGNQAWARVLCMCRAQCLLAANRLSLRVLGEIQTDRSSQPSLIADSESTYLWKCTCVPQISTVTLWWSFGEWHSLCPMMHIFNKIHLIIQRCICFHLGKAGDTILLFPPP